MPPAFQLPHVPEEFLRILGGLGAVILGGYALLMDFHNGGSSTPEPEPVQAGELRIEAVDGLGLPRRGCTVDAGSITSQEISRATDFGGRMTLSTRGYTGPVTVNVTCAFLTSSANNTVSVPVTIEPDRGTTVKVEIPRW